MANDQELERLASDLAALACAIFKVTQKQMFAVFDLGKSLLAIKDVDWTEVKTEIAGFDPTYVQDLDAKFISGLDQETKTAIGPYVACFADAAALAEEGVGLYKKGYAFVLKVKKVMGLP